MGTSKTQKKATLRFVKGWVDCSIHQFLQGIDRIPERMTWTIISCLDSCPDVVSLVQHSRHLGKIQDHCQPLGQAIVVKTQTLLDLNRHDRIFFGFDEVWFMGQPDHPQPQNQHPNFGNHTAISPNFSLLAHSPDLRHPFGGQTLLAQGRREDPPEHQPPLQCPFLLSPSDLNPREEQFIQQLMHDWQISCGLGDGIGMNYRVSRSQTGLLAYLLEAHELSRDRQETTVI